MRWLDSNGGGGGLNEAPTVLGQNESNVMYFKYAAINDAVNDRVVCGN